ncbi:dihydrofolate reductase [Pseudohyphozyma bogoriensis]|nr:dihydrofolate reductase [Pseudohyphozyma bogoriensis]
MARKLRILMLCGDRQNAAYFHGKTKVVREEMNRDVEFVFVDPPLLIHTPTQSSEDYLASSSDVATLPAENMPRAWWTWADGSIYKYGDYETSLKFLRGVLETQGPFDGVWGFSQGACTASLLMALIETPSLHPVWAAPGANWPPKQFEFGILCGGFLATDPEYRNMLLQSRIRVPVLLAVGTADTTVATFHSDAFIDLFENKRVEYHSGNHFVPTKPSWRALYKGYIEGFQFDDLRAIDRLRSPSFDRNSGWDIPLHL